MTLASRVADLATRIAQELKPVEGVFTPATNVAASTLILRKVGSLVTLQGSIVMTSSMPADAMRPIGTVAVGFRPPQQVGAGAYFYDPTGTAGAVLISSTGSVSVLHASGTRGSCAFSAAYRVA